MNHRPKRTIRRRWSPADHSSLLKRRHSPRLRRTRPHHRLRNHHCNCRRNQRTDRRIHTFLARQHRPLGHSCRPTRRSNRHRDTNRLHRWRFRCSCRRSRSYSLQFPDHRRSHLRLCRCSSCHRNPHAQCCSCRCHHHPWLPHRSCRLFRLCSPHQRLGTRGSSQLHSGSHLPHRGTASCI